MIEIHIRNAINKNEKIFNIFKGKKIIQKEKAVTTDTIKIKTLINLSTIGKKSEIRRKFFEKNNINIKPKPKKNGILCKFQYGFEGQI